MRLPRFSYKINNQHGYVPILLVLIVIVVLGAGAFFVFSKLKSTVSTLTNSSQIAKKPQNVNTAIPEKISGNRERGSATDEYPYGETKEETILRIPLRVGQGAAVEATLSGNIKAYVIFPEGAGRDDELVITPYYSMPTLSQATPLSNELGYGLDISLTNSNWDAFNTQAYLVFDLDGGKTIKEIDKDKNLKFYCSPKAVSFDPAACALFNKVDVSNHTNFQYAVITPARDNNAADLIWMNSTVPIGFDNLIVARITRQATYIPQKLSKELLVDLVKANRIGSNYNIPQIEGVILGIEHDLFTFEDLQNSFASSFSNSTHIYDFTKSLYTIPKYKAYLESKLKAYKAAPVNGDNINSDGSDSKVINIENSIKNSDQLLIDVKKYFLEELSRVHGTRDGGYNAHTTVAQVRRLEKVGFEGMKDKRVEMFKIINADLNYFMEKEYADFDPALYPAIQASLLAIPEYAPGVVADTRQDLMNFSFIKIVKAEDVGSGDGGDAAARAAAAARGTLNNPNATLGELYDAMKTAAELGDWDLVDELAEKMRKKIEDDLNNDRYNNLADLLRDWQLYQMISDDEDLDKYQQKFIDKVVFLRTRQICTTLMEKNLKNFAWNQIQCTKFVE